METITITSNVYEKSLPYKYFCNGFINITDILYKKYKIIEFFMKIYKHYYGYSILTVYNITSMLVNIKFKTVHSLEIYIHN